MSARATARFSDVCRRRNVVFARKREESIFAALGEGTCNAIDKRLVRTQDSQQKMLELLLYRKRTPSRA